MRKSLLSTPTLLRKIYHPIRKGLLLLLLGNFISQGICAQVVPTCGSTSSVMLIAHNTGSLTNPTYSLNPGGFTSATNSFIVNSPFASSYTLYITGTNSQSQVVTNTIVNTVSITPAPLAFINVAQATCGNTLAVVSLTPAGSAGNPAFIYWSPTPLALNTSTTIANYVIPNGPLPMNITVSVADPLGCVVTVTAAINPAPPIPVVSVYNGTGSYNITCSTPSIQLSALTNYTYGTLSYFWASNSATYSTANVNITTPGTLTLTVTDPVTLCSATKTISIGINTVSPINFVTPLSQVVNCTATSVSNVTVASNPTVNVTQTFYSPSGGSYAVNSFSATYQPFGPGTYTVCSTDNSNGCSTCKTFTVNSPQAYASFSVTATPGFSLGCSSKSVSVIGLVNGQSNPIGGTISYSLLTPGSSTSIPSTGVLSAISFYTLNVPGTYTAILRNNSNNCDVRVPFSVISNTFAPSLDSVGIPTQILDCNHPQVNLKAYSTTPNTSYVWSFPGNPGTVSGSSLSAQANTASPTSTLTNNYTLTLTDNNNLCKTGTVIPIYQNLFPPIAKINPLTASLSCLSPTVELNNFSTSGIPPGSIFPTNNVVIGYLWEGPTPQIPLGFSSSYIAAVPGLYTLTAKDLNNGCTGTTTRVVADNKIYPVVNNPVGPPPFCLTGPSVLISPYITSGGVNVTYQWQVPAGATVSGATSSVLATNMVGVYTIIVTNTISGCVSTGVLSVSSCTDVAVLEQDGMISVTIYPNPGNLFHIESSRKGLIVDIYDVTGRTVHNMKVEGHEAIIDLRNQPKGIYYYKIKNGNSTTEGKLINQ